jgi:hypothetical protein
MTATLTREDVRALREDLGLFSRTVGHPLADWQAEDLRLETFRTVIVGARRTGKTRALAVLAVWWAFRRSGQRVLIVSAGEESARGLLWAVRDVLAGHPMLAASLVDEQQGMVSLDNGSQVRAVSASARAIRGKDAHLLIVDEAAFIQDDEAIIEGAAVHTVGAHTASGEARIVMACSPWEASGVFFRWARLGESGDERTRTFRWRLDRCPWVAPWYIEDQRQQLSPMRFRAEIEAEFVEGGTGFFSRADLLAAVAPYPLVPPERARGGGVVAGCDWGNRNDQHAICLLGVLDDYGMNRQPVFYVPWIETSQARYRDQVERVAAIAKAAPSRGGLRPSHVYETARALPRLGSPFGYHVTQIMSEVNGVGGPATEALEERVGWKVTRVTTTAESKERSFSRLLDLLSSDQLVLPDDVGLLRELSGLEGTATAHGGLRIAAAGRGHDDRALALSFCALALDARITLGPVSDLKDAPPDDQWLTTESGVMVPALPRPRGDGFTDGSAFLRGADYPI